MLFWVIGLGDRRYLLYPGAMEPGFVSSLASKVFNQLINGTFATD